MPRQCLRRLRVIETCRPEYEVHSETLKGVSLGVNEALARFWPTEYIRGLGFDPFEWQAEVFEPEELPAEGDRVALLCCRQAGKSTVVSGDTLHISRFQQRSRSLIICPAQDQSKEVMKKVEDFMYLDEHLPATKHDNTFEKEFVTGSRIIALPGTERSVRGYSSPALIFFDEAARVLDTTYKAARPMLTACAGAIIAATTPWGKRGWFYRLWVNPKSKWRKILVRVRWDEHNGHLVEHMPEDEFKAYWAERGVSAYYSPRHSKAWCEEELGAHGPVSYKQEYCCEFLEDAYSMFNMDDVMASLRAEQADIFKPEASEMITQDQLAAVI